MPHVAQLPAASRFFARIDRFECECPSCGQIILSSRQARGYDLDRLKSPSEQRAAAKLLPQNRSVRRLIYNPLTQRLKCPHCNTSYTVGLLLYPLHHGGRYRPVQPPDTIPSRREMAELRRYAGGWWLNQQRKQDDPVNQVVDNPCRCQPQAWVPGCPVHDVPPGSGHKPHENLT
jgi:hypothetical protein